MQFIPFDQQLISLTKELLSHYQNDELKSDSVFEQLYFMWTKPPKEDQGHIAFPCFILAKHLKKKPFEIANELADFINGVDANKKSTYLFSKAQAAGPYLNFYFSAPALGNHLQNLIKNGEMFQPKFVKNAPKTMVEYSQPNTHKEIHVGHMRNLCLGNSLVNLLRYSGVDTLAATYPGDVGTHVAKCLWYLKKHVNEEAPKENRGEWLGKMYAKGNLLLEDQLGTEQEEKNRQELTHILKEIHQGSGEYYDLWQETREWSIQLMKDLYLESNVQFDHWFFESEVDAPSVKLAHEYYEKGVFIKDQGAIGMDLSDDKLGFCILIKSDGNGLYSTKDVSLAIKKFEEFNIENNIYIVDERQSYHFKQVFKVLEKIGFKQAKDCLHLAYNFVELPDGAMSSRKGNIVPINQLLTEMKNHITEKYLERYRGQWSDQEISDTAHVIADGAIKFGMTRIDPQRKIVFDMDEWLKLDGPSGPYLQYTCARINSILKKTDELATAQNKGFTKDLTDLETNILVKFKELNQVILQSVKKYNPSLLCHYCYELASLYNRYYAESSILKCDDEDIKHQRILLTKMTHEILVFALKLLGITAPDKM